MSQESSEGAPIELAYRAISRLDESGLVALCAPEVVFESRITSLEDARYQGHDGVRRYIRNLRDAFETVDVEGSDLIEDQDRAVLTNDFRARGRLAGVEVEQRFYVAAKSRDGTLVWWALFDSRTEALAAVGLSE